MPEPTEYPHWTCPDCLGRYNYGRLFPDAPHICPVCLNTRHVRSMPQRDSLRVYWHDAAYDPDTAPQTAPCHVCHRTTVSRVRVRLTDDADATVIVCRDCFVQYAHMCDECGALCSNHLSRHGLCASCCDSGISRPPRCDCGNRIVPGNFLPVDMQADGSYRHPEGHPGLRAGHTRRPLCVNCYRDLVMVYRAVPDPPEEITFADNPHNRLVGIEIECIVAGMPRLWQWGSLHRDGSLSSLDESMIGREFSSVPAKGDYLLAMIRSVCAELARVKATANGTCGLHVHLDMRESSDSARHRVMKYWAAFEPIIFGLVAASRRDNSYCLSLANANGSRYQALNTAALSKWGTFEVRLHHGTVDAEEIIDWVRLLLRIFSAFEKTAWSPARAAKLAEMSPRERLLAFKRLVGLERRDWVSVIGRLKKHNTRHDFITLTTKKKAGR